MRECSVEDMISISAKPALLRHASVSAKHRGMKFADVPADYLEWIRDKSDLKEDVKFSCGALAQCAVTRLRGEAERRSVLPKSQDWKVGR